MTTDFAARHTMANPDWYTPKPIIDAAHEVLGGIDLDPASDETAQAVVRAEAYYNEAANGLVQTWVGSVFLNPPGGLVAEFWIKLMAEYEARRTTQFIWVGYSLEQLQTLQIACEGQCRTPLDFALCFPRKRLAFTENAAGREARIAKVLTKGDSVDASVQQRKAAARLRAGKPLKNGPSHANYLAYGGSRGHRFGRVFSQFGQVLANSRGW